MTVMSLVTLLEQDRRPRGPRPGTGRPGKRPRLPAAVPAAARAGSSPRDGRARRSKMPASRCRKPSCTSESSAGEIAHRAAPHTVALALRSSTRSKKAWMLGHRIGVGIREGRSQAALDECLGDAIDDRVAQVFLALEVVVEVALADSALAEHVVQRGGLVALHVDEPGGRVQDLVPRGRALGASRLGLGLGLADIPGSVRHRRPLPSVGYTDQSVQNDSERTPACQLFQIRHLWQLVTVRKLQELEQVRRSDRRAGRSPPTPPSVVWMRLRSSGVGRLAEQRPDLPLRLASRSRVGQPRA